LPVAWIHIGFHIRRETKAFEKTICIIIASDNMILQTTGQPVLRRLRSNTGSPFLLQNFVRLQAQTVAGQMFTDVYAHTFDTNRKQISEATCF